MGKILTVLALLLLFVKSGWSQDSVLARNGFSELFQQEYNFFTDKALTHSLMPINEYAIVSGSYMNEKGGFMARQDAPAERKVIFQTAGTRHLKAYKVSGAFSYTHTNRDSVGYTLGNYEILSPYYFYSAAKGNWEVSKYNLKGIVSRAFADDKLTFSAKGSFIAGNAWRSNDPRMEEFVHDLSGDLAVSYKLNRNNTIGIQGGFSSLSQENSNEYRNKDYQDNLKNLAYINFINYGYGLITIQTTNRQMYNYRKSLDLSGLYSIVLPTGSLTITGELSLGKSKILRKANESASDDFSYGRFEEEMKGVDLLWLNNKPGLNQWSLRGGYKSHYGKDFNTVIKGNNFVYYSDVFFVNPVFGILKDNQLKYEFSLNGVRERLYKADGTSDHKIDYINTDIGLNAGWYLSVNEKGSFLKLGAGVVLGINNRAEIDVPASQENDFSKDVVYYDYYYNNAKTTTFNMEAIYNFLLRKTTFFIKGNYWSRKAVLPSESVIPSEFPGNKRNNVTLTAGFTL